MTISRESVRQYAVASIVAAGLTTLLSLYLAVRRGYFDLSILNKSLASTSLLLLGIILLLGPLSRVYNRFDRWLIYRKEFGIIAFFLGAVHVYLAMFHLARRGPFGFYLARPWSAFPGLAGLLIMAVLFAFSFETVKKKLEQTTWWKLQFRGVRLAALAVFFHMSILKYTEWISWYQGNAGQIAKPSFPPASLLVALFSAFVILVRLTELFSHKAVRTLIPVYALLAIGTTTWLFLR